MASSDDDYDLEPWEDAYLEGLEYFKTNFHKIDPTQRMGLDFTILHFMIKNADSEAIRVILDDGRVDPNAMGDGNHQMTPLGLSIMLENETIAIMLLQDKRVDPSIKDGEGNNCLHYACELDSPDILRLILEDSRCDPNEPNDDGATPLLVATINCAMVLLDDPRVDPSIPHSVDNYIALQEVCYYGQKELFKKLWNHPKSDIQYINEDGHNCIHFAMYSPETEILKFLLDDGRIDPNIPDSTETNMSLLHILVVKENIDALEHCLKHPKLNINQKDGFGRSAWHIAKWKNNAEIEAMLLERGIDTTLEDNFTVDTVIHHPDFDIYNVDNNNEPQLYRSFNLGDLEVVQSVMRDKRFSINWIGNSVTVLHLAVSSQNISLVELILNQPGVDVNIDTPLLGTPLSHALVSFSPTTESAKLIQLLLEVDGIHYKDAIAATFPLSDNVGELGFLLCSSLGVSPQELLQDCNLDDEEDILQEIEEEVKRYRAKSAGVKEPPHKLRKIN